MKKVVSLLGHDNKFLSTLPDEYKNNYRPHLNYNIDKNILTWRIFYNSLTIDFTDVLSVNYLTYNSAVRYIQDVDPEFTRLPWESLIADGPLYEIINEHPNNIEGSPLKEYIIVFDNAYWFACFKSTTILSTEIITNLKRKLN